MKAFDPQDVTGIGARVLHSGPICDECLGRIAARLGRGLTNAERGRRIRDRLNSDGVRSQSGVCWLCEGLFDSIPEWARRAAKQVEAYEYTSYLFGVQLTPRLEQMEAFFNERFPSEHRESVKHSINRAMGMAFESCIDHPATVDFHAPHVSFVVDLRSDALEVQILSLYLYGRYRKLVRGIPQTRWPCRKCGGRGCEACAYTGRQYRQSVEEIIAAPLVEMTQAASTALHGAGREDIDARMLGNGRPFVLELRSPKRRSIRISDAHRRVNEGAAGRVEITPLQIVRRDTVEWVKSLRATKSYRATVEFERPVEAGVLYAAIESMPGKIAQRTPQRVAHRRADLIRHRVLHEAAGSWIDPTHARIEVRGDGGLYIKELMSGDNGRTTPNLAERVGVPARVIELDVLDVHAADLPQAMASNDLLP